MNSIIDFLFRISYGFDYLMTLVIGIILMENILSVKRTEENKYWPILIVALIVTLVLPFKGLILDLIFPNYISLVSVWLVVLLKLAAFILLGVYIVLSLVQLLKLKEEAPKYQITIYILLAIIMLLTLCRNIVTIKMAINIITLSIWIVSIALIVVFIIWNIFDKQKIAISKNCKKSLMK